MRRTTTAGRTIGLATLALGVAFVTGCGGSGDSAVTPPPPPSTTNAISVGNNFFDPKATTVPVATTVTWTYSPGSVQHNIAFDDGVKSGNQSTGQYQRTFNTAGSYPYHCTIHGTAMSGTITVK